jgi:hypothetical protein
MILKLNLINHGSINKQMLRKQTQLHQLLEEHRHRQQVEEEQQLLVEKLQLKAVAK